MAKPTDDTPKPDKKLMCQKPKKLDPAKCSAIVRPYENGVQCSRKHSINGMCRQHYGQTLVKKATNVTEPPPPPPHDTQESMAFGMDNMGLDTQETAEPFE